MMDDDLKKLREEIKEGFLEKARGFDEFKDLTDNELNEEADKFVSWRVKELVKEFCKAKGVI